MTTVPATSEPYDRSGSSQDVFPERLVALVGDTTVSHRMLALLYSLVCLIEAVSPEGDRPAFIQQRDVAYYANLDRKTVFSARDAQGLTLIERASAHGMRYQPGSSERLVHTTRGPAGESGSYAWAAQISPTGSGALGLPQLEGPLLQLQDDAAQACGGNLHSEAVDGLRALLHPGAPIWTPHRAGLAAWRLTCLLVLGRGAGPNTVSLAESAALLGTSMSSARRILHRLAEVHLAAPSEAHWMFDTAHLMRLRTIGMEGRRDTVLGLDYRDRKTGLGDKRDSIENRYSSDSFIRIRTGGAAKAGSEKWFLGHRDALLATAEALSAAGPGCQPDPLWVTRVGSLTRTTVGDYLARSTPVRATGTPAAEVAAPTVEPSEEEVQQRRVRIEEFRAHLSSTLPPVRQVEQPGDAFWREHEALKAREGLHRGKQRRPSRPAAPVAAPSEEVVPRSLRPLPARLDADFDAHFGHARPTTPEAETERWA